MENGILLEKLINGMFKKTTVNKRYKQFWLRLILKLVLYLEDLANANNGFNLVPRYRANPLRGANINK